MTDNTTTRVITFPSGIVHFRVTIAGNNFIDWWNGTVYTGGSTITYDVPYDQFPVFHRQGSILPLKVTSNCCNHGDENSRGRNSIKSHCRNVNSIDIAVGKRRMHFSERMARAESRVLILSRRRGTYY